MISADQYEKMVSDNGSGVGLSTLGEWERAFCDAPCQLDECGFHTGNESGCPIDYGRKNKLNIKQTKAVFRSWFK